MVSIFFGIGFRCESLESLDARCVFFFFFFFFLAFQSHKFSTHSLIPGKAQQATKHLRTSPGPPGVLLFQLGRVACDKCTCKGRDPDEQREGQTDDSTAKAATRPVKSAVSGELTAAGSTPWVVGARPVNACHVERPASSLTWSKSKRTFKVMCFPFVQVPLANPPKKPEIA